MLLGGIAIGGASSELSGALAALRKLSGQDCIPSLARAWADPRYCEGSRSTVLNSHAWFAACASLAGPSYPFWPSFTSESRRALAEKRAKSLQPTAVPRLSAPSDGLRGCRAHQDGDHGSSRFVAQSAHPGIKSTEPTLWQDYLKARVQA